MRWLFQQRKFAKKKTWGVWRFMKKGCSYVFWWSHFIQKAPLCKTISDRSWWANQRISPRVFLGTIGCTPNSVPMVFIGFLGAYIGISHRGTLVGVLPTIPWFFHILHKILELPKLGPQIRKHWATRTWSAVSTAISLKMVEKEYEACWLTPRVAGIHTPKIYTNCGFNYYGPMAGKWNINEPGPSSLGAKWFLKGVNAPFFRL